MNIAPATIQTALIVLKRQYVTIAASKPEPKPGTGDHNLREIALVNIRMAINDLQSLEPEIEDSNS